MIEIEKVRLERLIIHHVGNRSREEGCHFSQGEATVSDHLQSLLIEHYLSPLANEREVQEFYHESDLSLNAMARFSQHIFANQSAFKEESEKIAQHLYQASQHPNIAGGEFMVMLFSGIQYAGVEHLGLAVLKVETKDDYLDVQNEAGVLQLLEKEGIALREVQKGALILSAENHLRTIDLFKKRTKYWLEDFLKVRPKQTEDATLRAGRDILRGLSTEIENPRDTLNFQQQLNQYLESHEDLPFGELESLSKPYVDQAVIDDVFERAQSKAGFTLDEGAKVATDRFKAQAKSVLQKMRIIEGVNLVVTDRDTYLNQIQLEEREGGVRAIIDIDLYRDEDPQS